MSWGSEYLLEMQIVWQIPPPQSPIWHWLVVCRTKLLIDRYLEMVRGDYFADK